MTLPELRIQAGNSERIRLRTGRKYVISVARGPSDAGSASAGVQGDGLPLLITVVEATGAGALQPGAPVAGAAVVITPGDRQRRAARETDAQGVVRFESLPQGQCQIRVSKDGFREEHLPAFWLAAKDASLSAELHRLEALESLTVQLRNPEGQPVAGASVRLQTPAQQTRVFSSQSNAAGDAVLKQVPVGTYGVEARHEASKAHGTEQVEVAAGQENRVEITLRPGVPLYLATPGQEGAWAAVGHAYAELWEEQASPRFLGLFRSDATGCLQSLASHSESRKHAMLPHLFRTLIQHKETALPKRLRDRLRDRQPETTADSAPASPPLFPSESRYRLKLHRRRPGQASAAPPATSVPLAVEKGSLAGAEQHALLVPAGPLRLRVQLSFPRQRIASLEVCAFPQAGGQALARVACSPESFRTGASLGRQRRTQREFCEVELPGLSVGAALRLAACYRLQDGFEMQQELSETCVSPRDLVF